MRALVSSRTWQRFMRQKLAGLGLILVLGWVVAGRFGTTLTSHNPTSANFEQRYQPPSWRHFLGTDQFGRDILSRLLLGSRLSLDLGLAVTVMALLIGTLLGVTAGYLGGALDALIMRGVDTLLAFPLIYLLVACVALFGADWKILVLIMSLTSWMDLARFVRAEVMSLKERDFIKAAHVLGFGRCRIMFRHLLPNALAPVIAFAALRLADVILLEASLSFLGLGIQPPAVSWGSIIRDGRDVLASAWWIATFPGLALLFTVMALNWVAEGLRKALDV
ncbi:ABC transporter permease [candidate division KSB1 bacterium]|nr:MAG: ABC transporter permease [candidate division KSB1 bacterium]MBC6948677.1 ABC transporter permease [candidate division KSB1 bacterium]MCE7941614.1 ABC transporter permease [Chlorobi bacterium CHB1]MDL1878540.1 ABC transporter permease [Cytophagia bacterium CHB2]